MNPLTPEQINTINSFTPEQKAEYNRARNSGLDPLISFSYASNLSPTTAKKEKKPITIGGARDFVVDTLNIRGLGEGTGGAIGANTGINRINESIDSQNQDMTGLINLIREKRGRGEDVSRLLDQLSSMGGQIRDTGNAATDITAELPENREVVGSAVSLASLAAAGPAGRVAGNLVRNPIARKGAEMFVEGAIDFGGVTAGEQIAENRFDPLEIGKNMAIGGSAAVALGGLALGAIGATRLARSGKPLSTLREKLTPARKASIDALPTNEYDEAVTSIKNSYQKAFVDDSTAINNQLSKLAERSGKNKDQLLEELAKEGYVPKINGKLADMTDVITDTRENRARIAEGIQEALTAYDDRTVPLSTLRKNVYETIRNSDFISSANIDRSLAEADRVFNSFSTRYGDTITPSQMNRIRIDMNRQTKAFNNEIFQEDVSNAIGREVRTQIDEIVPDALVRQANQDIARYFELEEAARIFNNKQVKVGILGTTLGRFAGATLLGGLASPLTGGAGSLVVAGLAATYGGDFIAGLLRNRAFSKKAQDVIKRELSNNPDILQKLIDESTAENKKIFKQLQLQAPAEGSPRIQMESGEAINLPSRSQSTIDAEEISNVKKKNVLAETIKEWRDEIRKNGERGSIQAYEGEKDLTTKILKDLEGKTTVSKQYILDATNRGELKQVERDLIRGIAEREGDTVNVADFAKRVKAELLPLTVKKSNDIYYNPRNPVKGRYENISLPDELRGKVKDYRENIYESPIKTSAGDVHFGGEGTDNYFGHTRIEDMADNKTRRVIEVQSDLYQKGRLDSEDLPKMKVLPDVEVDYKNIQARIEALSRRDDLPQATRQAEISKAKRQLQEILEKANEPETLARKKEVDKLRQYNDPTAHFRMVREEIKQAAIDGKTKLQFPTGETAMKIEGLANRSDKWVTLDNEIITGRNIKDGDVITYQTEEGIPHEDRRYLITKNYGDGTFDAVDSWTAENDYDFYQYLDKNDLLDDGRVPTLDELQGVLDDEGMKMLSKMSEKLSALDTVDTNNPIYRFYEKEMQKYLNKFGGKKIVDENGVSWIEVPITKEMKGPVEAFGKISLGPLFKVAGASAAGMGLASASSKTTFQREAEASDETPTPVKKLEQPVVGTNYDPYDPDQTRENANGEGAVTGVTIDETMVAVPRKKGSKAAMVKLGTVVYIPELDDIFLVADLMNRRFDGQYKFERCPA